MATSETRIVAGNIQLDMFGERLFLIMPDDRHITLGDRTITGGHEIRVLGGGTNFENEILASQVAKVSIAARLATPEELKGLAREQLTDPTLTAVRIVRFGTIQQRAFDIFQSEGGAAEDNWLRAERELLVGV